MKGIGHFVCTETVTIAPAIKRIKIRGGPKIRNLIVAMGCSQCASGQPHRFRCQPLLHPVQRFFIQAAKQRSRRYAT
jgi:hypothetical protein